MKRSPGAPPGGGGTEDLSYLVPGTCVPVPVRRSAIPKSGAIPVRTCFEMMFFSSTRVCSELARILLCEPWRTRVMGLCLTPCFHSKSGNSKDRDK